jgi:dTDP-4-amino-4,6-dideoxygalactose transaminase
VLDSGWLAEGKVTREFERKVAEYVGAKHAVAMCNCTVALELCLRALNVTGEVLIPSFTHYATACAVINAGAAPVFADVAMWNYNINCEPVAHPVKTAVPVSWGGNPEWFTVADRIVEDAACSLGAKTRQFRTGQHFTTCFSFHPRKLITTGEGGMVTTNDRVLTEDLRVMKNFGVGNYKLSDVASAIGLAQVERLREIIYRRRRMAKIYTDLLKTIPDVEPPHERRKVKSTYQTYAVLLNNGNRDEIIQKLGKQGIETQIGTYALHLHKPFTHFRREGLLKNSERLYRNLLALPMAYDLTDEDQHRVVDALKRELA